MATSSGSALPGRFTPSRAPFSGSAPFLLVNPRAGSGIPAPAELIERAKRLGIEAATLDPGDDAGELFRAAGDRGAKAIGVAGGDGSLAAGAAVAVERDVPFFVVPLGTENHFARDLGLDRADPLGALAAVDGEERRVDVGSIGDRLFLNNVSLGLYASMVHDPHHEQRNRLVAFARMVLVGLGKSRRPLELFFEVDGFRERRSVLVALVANNDYRSDAPADLAERPRLDEGLLHTYVVEAVSHGALVRLLARAAAGRLEGARGWVEWAGKSFRVESRHPRIHVAIDGEPAVLESPLDFRIKPRALRVLLPRSGDGASAGDASR